MRKALGLLLSAMVLTLVLTGSAWSAPADELAIAKEILRLTNQERAAVGAAPLTLDTATLAGAAHGHSQEMATLGYFSHTSPVAERRTVAERVRLAGGTDALVSENLYHGPAADIAGEAVKGFMNSPSHRAAMLNPNYNVLGLGVVRQNGHAWVTEVFANRPINVSVQRNGNDLTVSGQVLSGERSGAVVVDGTVVARWEADSTGHFTTKLTAGGASKVQLAQVLGSTGGQTSFRIVGTI